MFKLRIDNWSDNMPMLWSVFYYNYVWSGQLLYDLEGVLVTFQNQ